MHDFATIHYIAPQIEIQNDRKWWFNWGHQRRLMINEDMTWYNWGYDSNFHIWSNRGKQSLLEEDLSLQFQAGGSWMEYLYLDPANTNKKHEQVLDDGMQFQSYRNNIFLLKYQVYWDYWAQVCYNINTTRQLPNITQLKWWDNTAFCKLVGE